MVVSFVLSACLAASWPAAFAVDRNEAIAEAGRLPEGSFVTALCPFERACGNEVPHRFGDFGIRSNQPPFRPCEGAVRKGPKKWPEKVPNGKEGLPKRLRRSAKKQERQPKPLRKRPPRRRHEQHLAALPYGERPSTASCLQDPFGSGWRFMRKQFSTHLKVASIRVVSAAFVRPRGSLNSP